MKAMKINLSVIAIWSLAVVAGIPAVATAAVERYVIDTEGGHAFVQFRIKHLAYSWLYGGFNDFSGTFTYDTEDTSNSRVELTINTASLDSNHAERDKHLRGKDFLDVERYPRASFKSTGYKETGFNTSVLEGELTLKGITKPLRIEVQRIGNGPDPWGGYRRGFQGSTSFALKDFGIDYDLGPAARKVEMILSIEGIRQ